MTDQQHEHLFPYYRAPSAIRKEVFSHKMRGFDEDEVREYLALLADQVQATESEQAEVRAEIQQLRAENDRLRGDIEQHQHAAPPPPPPPAQVPSQAPPQAPERLPERADATRQAEALLRQAQQAADQLVEEAVRYARQVMTSAKAEQREIVSRAQEAAESVASAARAAEARSASLGSVAPMPEVEQVRNYARVAQVQLRAILESLAYQVDHLGEAPSAHRMPQLPPAPNTIRASYQPGSSRDGNGHAGHWHADGWPTDR